jgi:AAA domain
VSTLVEPIILAEAPIVKSAFRREGLGYAWDIDHHNVVMRADYLSDRSNELHAEVTVTLKGRHLHLARFNLSSSTSRSTLSRALEAITGGLDIPWKTLVEQFSVGVLKKEREGEPVRHTGATERRQAISYLIDSLVMRGKTNMLYAPGGSGKGMLCVGMCCAVASRRGFAGLSVMEGRPIYFDWEDDFETFEDRLNAVARGMDVDVPQIAYQRMRGLAADRINEIARAISNEGTDFGIIDSFSAAGGTISDRIGWDTVAHRLFDALDLVPNMTWLIIDHVTGDKLKDPAGKAYGSIQKMNRVRNAWEMRSDQEPGSSTVHMRLYHAKWNHTGRKRPIGIRMEFSGETVTVDFSAEDPVQQQIATTLPDRMAQLLIKGPLSTAMIAIALDVKESSVRAELVRSRDRFDRDERGFVRLRPAIIEDEQTSEDLPW